MFVCVCVCVNVCVPGPSVLTRLLESDMKSDWTRLENEYRAGERKREKRKGRRRRMRGRMMKSREKEKINGRGREGGSSRDNGLILTEIYEICVITFFFFSGAEIVDGWKTRKFHSGNIQFQGQFDFKCDFNWLKKKKKALSLFLLSDMGTDDH